MANVVLDTSFISALANPKDSHHSEAIEILRSTSKETRLVCPYTVLLELAMFPESRSGQSRIGLVDLACELVDEFIEVDKQFIYGVASKNYPAALKAIDATLLYATEIASAELYTFDKKLLKVSSA